MPITYDFAIGLYINYFFPNLFGILFEISFFFETFDFAVLSETKDSVKPIKYWNHPYGKICLTVYWGDRPLIPIMMPRQLD